jgi:F-type H+-transporting ATPase subunit a
MEISLAAEQITHIGGFPITNTIILAWIAMGILICFGMAATYKLVPVPGRLQNFFELIVEKSYDFVKSVIGSDKDTERVYPFIITFFIFILFSNWLGLIPGVGTIGVGDSHFLPFLRAPASDLNTTLAFALISVSITNIFGIAAIGFSKHIGKFISFKSPLAFFVGMLETIAEVAKILSFSFRLFGNVFAGEVLLVVVASLIPYIAPLPFLGLEVFVGFIQALVFSMLTLIFIKVAITEIEH